MSPYRRAPRRDANEKDIVDALKHVGALVHRLDGKDIPDLLVGFDGQWFLMEVKMPLGPKGGTVDHQVLSPGQQGFFDEAHRRRLPTVLVRSPIEAIEAIGADLPQPKIR